MKKHIKQVVVTVLGIISLIAMPLNAADKKPALKLEDAIKSGFIYSSQVSLNSKERDVLKESLEAKMNKAYKIYQTVYLQKAKNEHQKQIIEDQITYDITKRYYGLVLLEKELHYLDQSIIEASKEIVQMKVKKQLGLLDDVKYESMEIQLQDLKNTRKAKEESLKNDRSYFKLITGKDVTKYTLEDTINYEVFRIPGEIDCYMDTLSEEFLKSDQELAQFAKDNILSDGGPVIYYSDYLDQNYNADKTLSKLEDKRKEMKEALKDSYASLINLEEQISNAKTKLALVEKQVNIAKVQYENQLITELDYEKQKLNVESIELNRRGLIIQYNLLKQVIEKPWKAISVSE